MDKEEKKAIEYLKRHIIPVYGSKGQIEYLLNDIVLNLIEKQQKEIEELKEKDNSKYYHTINSKELENEINNAWKNKIRELKQKVEEEMISNPYDFSYMIQELLEE